MIFETIQDIFLTILNMSITASIVMLFICMLRIFLKKVPKILSYGLWSVMLFRLVCPISFSSVFSLLGGRINAPAVPSGTIAYIPQDIGMMSQPQTDMGIDSISAVVNNSLPAATTVASVNPMQIILFEAAVLWCAGIAALLIYSLVSHVLLKKKTGCAVKIYDNIYETDRITSPFVFGIFRPKIYIPVGLGENELSYILKHEKTHIQRRDYLVKPFAWLVLIVHWFNPLVWLAFALMTRDMEMSCDERVIREMGENKKADYSRSLLSLSIRGKVFAGSPLAFGESNTKIRVKNVIRYKKPPMWAMITAVAACMLIMAACVANPETNNDNTTTLAGKLFVNRTPYVGNNSKVAALTYVMPLPEGVSQESLQLQTKSEPYGITIHYSLEDDSKSYGRSRFFKNSALLFATVDNVETVSHIGHMSDPLLSSVNFYYTFNRTELELVFGTEFSKFAESSDMLAKLIMELDEMDEQQLEGILNDITEADMSDLTGDKAAMNTSR